MSTYYLTVIRPCLAPRAPLVATVLNIKVDQSIEWVKQHADEIAAQDDLNRPENPPPCALWVSVNDPFVGPVRFVVGDDESTTYGLSDMLSSNSTDDGLCEWLVGARAGDYFPDGEGCKCVAGTQ